MNRLKMNRILATTFAFALAISAAMAQTAKPQSTPKSSTTTKPARRPSGQSASGIPSNWNKVPIPALHEFKPQEPRRVEFPNGLVVFLQEDHELPVINGFIRVAGRIA